MAGDWIKMRADLRTHPKVVRVSSDLKSDRLRVIGALFVAWSIFDAHSSDGRLEGYTPDVLDAEVGLPGFAQALVRVGWLGEDFADGVQVLVAPRFSEHNGQSAKKRITDTERKREQRGGPASVRKTSDIKSDKSGTREEKRREDISHRTHTSKVEGEGVCVSDSESENGASPAATAACQAMLSAGVADAQAADPRLAALLQRGATADQLRSAAAIAVGKGKGAAYAFGVVDTQLREAVQMASGPQAPMAPWDTCRSGVEDMGESLGLGRWDEAAFGAGRGEIFAAYEARVRQAVQARGGAHAH